MLYEQKGGVGSDVRQGMGGPCRQMFSRLWPTSTIADSPTSFGQIQPWNPPCKIHTTSLFPHPQLSPTIVEWLSIEVGDRVSAKASNPSPPRPLLIWWSTQAATEGGWWLKGWRRRPIRVGRDEKCWRLTHVPSPPPPPLPSPSPFSSHSGF